MEKIKEKGLQVGSCESSTEGRHCNLGYMSALFTWSFCHWLFSVLWAYDTKCYKTRRALSQQVWWNYNTQACGQLAKFNKQIGEVNLVSSPWIRSDDYTYERLISQRSYNDRSQSPIVQIRITPLLSLHISVSNPISFTSPYLTQSLKSKSSIMTSVQRDARSYQWPFRTDAGIRRVPSWVLEHAQIKPFKEENLRAQRGPWPKVDHSSGKNTTDFRLSSQCRCQQIQDGLIASYVKHWQEIQSM